MNKNKGSASDYRRQDGFTLIELLVVIAIIGILSSVVLASLSSARNKGKDAAVKSQLASMRAQAEIYYSTADTYVNICTADVATIQGAFGGTGGLIAAVISSEGVTTTPNTALDVAGSAVAPFLLTCHSIADAWAVDAPLVSGPATDLMYCVDSVGTSKAKATALGAGATGCL